MRRFRLLLRLLPLLPLLPLLLFLLKPPHPACGSHPSSTFVSLARGVANCTDNEYSYGTRCICTFLLVCESNQCNYESAPCGKKGVPYCIGAGEAARCIAPAAVNTTGFGECTPNTMLERHCLCGGEICPGSVFTTEPTFQLTVLNMCNSNLECVRDDYGAYTVFPFNGEITGADPAV